DVAERIGRLTDLGFWRYQPPHAALISGDRVAVADLNDHEVLPADRRRDESRAVREVRMLQNQFQLRLRNSRQLFLREGTRLETLFDAFAPIRKHLPGGGLKIGRPDEAAPLKERVPNAHRRFAGEGRSQFAAKMPPAVAMPVSHRERQL